MSWPVVSVSEVARIVGGATPKSAVDEYWGGNVRWVTPKDLSNLDGKYVSDTPRKITETGLKSCAAKVLPTNSVLFSSRAPIGHVAINLEPMATNQGFKSFVPGEKLDSNFLYWWLDANRSKLQALGTGATFKEVSKSVVRRIKIPLPPLDEQKRIAAILDQADELRRLRQRAIDRLNQLGQAIFYEMFGDGNGFPMVELSELVDEGDKINYGVVQPGGDIPDGIQLVRVGDLLHPTLNVGRLKKISPVIEAKYKRSRLKGDEILIACVGSVGSIALATPEVRNANIARAVARVPISIQKANRVFISEQMKTNRIQRYFLNETRTVAQPTLNIKQIKETMITLPTIEKQNEFAEKISTLTALSDLSVNHLMAQEALITSLQQRAFRGEL